MQKAAAFLIMLLFLATPASFCTAREKQSDFSPDEIKAHNEIKVFIDREEASFRVPPLFDNGRLLVPLRAFSEALGAEISWDSEAEMVTIEKEGCIINLKVNEPYVLVNDKLLQTEISIVVMENCAMVPLSFFPELFDLQVHWEEENRIVKVESNNLVPFVRYSAGELAPWLQEWLESRWDELGIQARIVGGKLYILTTFGLKPSGGYGVEIKKIERTGEANKVVVDFKEPLYEHYTIPVFSRPYDLVYVDLAKTELSSYLICFTRGLNEGQLPIRLELTPDNH